MDNSIYLETVTPYVKVGMPVTPDFTLNLIDTNYLTDMNNISLNSPYAADFYKFMFNAPIIMPEAILQECAGSGKQQSMNHQRFKDLYEQTFIDLSQVVPIHIVTFSDLEKLMMDSNGGKKAEAFKKARMIAEELFVTNDVITTALANINQFAEIENALRAISKDAGERVLLFYAAIFQTDNIVSIMYTNETSVYVDRHSNSTKDKLLELLGGFDGIDYLDTLKVKSLDVAISSYLNGPKRHWNDDATQAFIIGCRNKKGRKLHISNTSSFSGTISCENNQIFYEKLMAWRGNGTIITF